MNTRSMCPHLRHAVQTFKRESVLLFFWCFFIYPKHRNTKSPTVSIKTSHVSSDVARF